MANIVLPTPGQKPWDLNAPITAMNAELNGRLSDTSISAKIDGVVSPIIPGNGARSVGRGEQWVSVKDFGAKVDGTTNDTAAVQAALDSFGSSGGVVLIPQGTCLVGSLTIPTAVILRGTRTMFGYGPTPRGGTRIRAVSGHTGVLITLLGANSGVTGLDVKGTSTTNTLIRTTNGSWNKISNVALDSCVDQAIILENGNGNVVEDVLITNALLNRARTDYAGVVEVLANSADNFLHRIEASASQTAYTSLNEYNVAILIRGSNNFIDSCVGEFSDTGIRVIAGQKNRFTGTRADRNFGTGFVVNGTGNQFANCSAIDNSLNNDGVFPGYRVISGGNMFANCRVSAQSGTRRATYGFEDTADNALVSQRNRYVNCYVSLEHVTLGLFSGVANMGSYFDVPRIPVRVQVSATVDARDSSLIAFGQAASPVTITSITGGAPGREVVLVSDTTQTITVQSNTAIRLAGATDKTLAQYQTLRLVWFKDAWYQV